MAVRSRHREWSLRVVVLAAIAASTTQAAAQTFTLFPIPNPGPQPFGITAGPDGNLWFTEQSNGNGNTAGNKIGRITPAGVVTEFTTPTGASRPLNIARGPDGNLWFTESNTIKISRSTPAGVITEFPVPTVNPFLNSITAGADGNVWFTEQIGKIGRITPAGIITEFAPPALVGSAPFGITAGPDGNVWFTEEVGNKIGRMNPAGLLTEFPIPTANSNPIHMTVGPDGNLWFIERGSNKIARIPTSATPLNPQIAEFAIPTANSQPWAITAGPDGNLWFTESNVGKIGRITPAGVITEFVIPTISVASPFGITLGPDGALWFVDLGLGLVGRLVPPPPSSQLFAAVLPSSRSVQVGGNIATAFASMINAGTSPASSCGVAPVTSVPAKFSFQTTDPATNTLTGTPNTPVSIPAGGTQTFLFAFEPNAPYSPPTNLQLGYHCDNLSAAATIVGVNTLLLTIDTNPVPDVIAVGLTPSNDGYSRTGGSSGTGIFVIAATNIGVSASLTARLRVSDSALPLTATVCQTDATTGQCLAAPSPTVTTTINQNQNTTWTAFVAASGAVAQNPATNRVFFEFVDASNVVRGSTSTAVTTQ